MEPGPRGEIIASGGDVTVRLLGPGDTLARTGKSIDRGHFCAFHMAGRGLLGEIGVGELRALHLNAPDLVFHRLKPNEARIPAQVVRDLDNALAERSM